MPERILITVDHHDVSSIKWALNSAYPICLGENCEAVICVPNKQQATAIALNEVIPVTTIKHMLKGAPLVLNNVKYWLESIGTLKRSGRKGVIIALYTPLADMKKIEELGCQAIIFVPWLPREGEQWRSQWNPTLIPPAQRDENLGE
jgi:hypothetical protein